MDDNRIISDKLILKNNLLILVINFEKLWYAYTFSDGNLYYQEIKEEAKKMVSLFTKIYGKKPLVSEDNSIINDDLWHIRQFIEEIERWSFSMDKYPKSFLGKEYTNSTPFYYQVVMMELESMLTNELNLLVRPTFSATTHEDYFRKEALKWAGQMPEAIVNNISDAYIRNMSKSDTIVMVADIRRSQDLMTYGLSPSYYTDNIIKFINEARSILHDNFAIFDRSTGDGFIAYFNKYVCEQNNKDYYQMMLDACYRIQSFSSFFEEWIKHIRKVPNEEIGLSIGIDSGIVSFKDIDNQMFAIGDACVWATRMCGAGKRGEVIFNNIPYHKIVEFGEDGFSQSMNSMTKNGESFRAYKINIPLVKYKTLPLKDPKLNKPTAIK